MEMARVLAAILVVVALVVMETHAVSVLFNVITQAARLNRRAVAEQVSIGGTSACGALA